LPHEQGGQELCLGVTKKENVFNFYITLPYMINPTPRHKGYETHACESHIDKSQTQCVLV
jgi:hypothetical protein